MRLPPPQTWDQTREAAWPVAGELSLQLSTGRAASAPCSAPGRRGARVPGPRVRERGTPVPPAQRHAVLPVRTRLRRGRITAPWSPPAVAPRRRRPPVHAPAALDSGVPHRLPSPAGDRPHVRRTGQPRAPTRSDDGAEFPVPRGGPAGRVICHLSGSRPAPGAGSVSPVKRPKFHEGGQVSGCQHRPEDWRGFGGVPVFHVRSPRQAVTMGMSPKQPAVHGASCSLWSFYCHCLFLALNLFYFMTAGDSIE